ncbi:MAG: NERD domain-containing protein [Kaiparowitsia implicata GSE-PSE-MK54-09C]|jgi:hypothetical protein|nr:NERD domain-containing protein [Kaiparowitsia implicata GSE-PSE-MK54-09C]
MSPGDYVRQLARQRRDQAYGILLTSGSIAAAIVVLLLVAIALGESIPPVLFLLVLIPPALTAPRVLALLKRARQADRGASAEESIAELLNPLTEREWVIEYGLYEPAFGDVDVFLRSPKGKHYVVEIKSHRCIVQTDGRYLYNFRNGRRRTFRKNFLVQARQQAVALKQSRKLGYVTPIIAFSNATVDISTQPVTNVYVVEHDKLLPYLEYLENDKPHKVARRPTRRPRKSKPPAKPVLKPKKSSSP